MGLSYTGISCFDSARVMGYNLVPDPPARIIPFTGAKLTNREKRENVNPWHIFAMPSPVCVTAQPRGIGEKVRECLCLQVKPALQ